MWRSYSLAMTCDPQLQMAKQGLSGGSGPKETLLGAGRGRIQAAGLHTRPHCRPLPASGASVPTWVDSTGRLDFRAGVPTKSRRGMGHTRGCRGRETTDNQETGMEPQPHGPWRPVPLGPSLLQAPVLCSGHCPSQGPESPPSLQPAGDGHSHSWPVAGFSEGQGCDMESRQTGCCTRLAGTLAQRPRAGRPAGAGVRPLRPPCSPGRSRGGRGAPPLSVTDS